MSKSRTRKWYDYDEDFSDYKKKKKGDDRRAKKKMKNNLRSKNYEVNTSDYEEDYR